jgi:hypothetical protein
MTVYRHKSTRIPAAFPYAPCKVLLSRGELAFYHALQVAVAGRQAIAIKTRLADILKCPDDLWQSIHGRRLAQKHVDFVLYDPQTTAIAAIIELDDRSHRLRDRRNRDRFVNESLRAANVPLLRVKAAWRYESAEIRDAIANAISASATRLRARNLRRRSGVRKGRQPAQAARSGAA